MRTLLVLIGPALIGVADRGAAQDAPRSSAVSVGSLGIGPALGPEVIATGRNAGGARERILATWPDGIAITLGLGLERTRGGLELRLLVPGAEPQVTSESGEVFPHHASRPLLWSLGVLGYPLPPIGVGNCRRLRLFVAAGAGGMLVTADLDNAGGQSIFHPLQWTASAGLRLDVSRDDARAGQTLLEFRVARAHLGRRGPFRTGEVTAFTLALGLAL